MSKLQEFLNMLIKYSKEYNIHLGFTDYDTFGVFENGEQVIYSIMHDEEYKFNEKETL